MFSKELCYRPMRSNKKSSEEQDEEETLSFCDLPIYSHASADWDMNKTSSSSPSSSSSSSQGESFFEFFSSGFNAPTHQPESIIFCGRMISPYNGSELSTSQTQNKPKTKNRLFHWVPTSFSRSKASGKGSSKSKTTPSNSKQIRKKLMYHQHVNNGTENLAGRRPEISSKSSRWCRFVFGSMSMPVLPAEMELADIRSRQKRPRNPKAFVAMFQDEQRNKLERNTTSVNGLKRLVRSLSCRGYYSTGTLDF